MINKMDLKRKSVRFGQALIYYFFIGFSILIFVPILLTLIVSFSSEESVMQKGFSFFPTGFSLDAYKYVFRETNILNAYWVSIRVTLIGTLFSVFVNSMAAYALSRKQVKYRNIIVFLLYFPSLLNPGVVAWYYNVKYVFHLTNTIWALILPNLVQLFNMLLIRNYYKTIPDSLEEAAKIDGAGPFQIYTKIMFPLALPIIATVTLFISVGYWNDWYLASWFITSDHKELYPLQYHLYVLWTMLTSQENSAATPTQTVYVATMFVTMGPIILVYPFIQKHFMKGIMVGAIKG